MSGDEAVVQEEDSEWPVPDEAAVRAATSCIRWTSKSGRLPTDSFQSDQVQ